MIALSGLPFEELAAALHSLPPYRASQIFKWISRGVERFEQMTDLSKDLRSALEESYTIYSSKPQAWMGDTDGSEKLQLRLHDGLAVEAVLLSDGKERFTACLSTQAGCPAGCVFCKTGSLGFARNLEANEIVEQFLYLSGKQHISNIVIMGMGEPLLNLDNLRKALQVLCDPRGCGISKRNITLSTCGIIDGIKDLADKGPDLRLALSLCSADEGSRRRLMPITNTNPLPALREALVYYQAKQRRRITLEIPLLGGINTRQEDADSLAAFISPERQAHLSVLVNVIPWNPAPGLELEGKPLHSPGTDETARFKTMLEKRGIKTTLRRRKGRGVSGACGQLGVVTSSLHKIASTPE
jgi:23S rRNA (adenine2503-C2)-methyltransferase